jgi:hypothetical protein
MPGFRGNPLSWKTLFYHAPLPLSGVSMIGLNYEELELLGEIDDYRMRAMRRSRRGRRARRRMGLFV